MTRVSPTSPSLTRILSMILSESAVYGVILVSGLLVIMANESDAPSAYVLVKVLGTSVVFWLAHVYAGTVSHLGDDAEPGEPSIARLRRAIRHSLDHVWGMLVSAVVPGIALGASALGLVTQGQAIWGTLWVNVGLLAVLGFWGVSRWSDRLWPRLAGALTTAGLGLVLVLLKALIH